MGSGISKKRRLSKSKSKSTPVGLDSPDSGSSSNTSPNKMHLFRRQSADAKKRFQHQQYLGNDEKTREKENKKRLQHQQYLLSLLNPLNPGVKNEDVVGAAPTGDAPTTPELSTVLLPTKAREAPDPTYDISCCELDEVPPGTYSLCKVFQKEALLLHSNWMTSLKGGGTLTDLNALRVLDLHNNEFTSLPNEISLLQCLQVLNLEDNKIKHLPETIGDLRALQSLNLKSNNIKHLPKAMCRMKSLRILDITNNRVVELSRNFCHIRTLEKLILDAADMSYPNADICSEGTESIMRFLCSECDIPYEPPSKFVLEILDPQRPSDMQRSPTQDALANEIIALSATVMEYEKVKEKKRLEQAQLEKLLEDEQRMQAELLANSMAHKQNLLSYMEQDQERFDKEMTDLQHKKETERQQLVAALAEAERGSEYLVRQLLEMNESAKKTEELLEKIERERMEAEQWFIVRQEELENVRKQEVIYNMEMILEDSSAFNQIFERYMANRDDVVRRAQETSNEVDDNLESVLTNKQLEQKLFIEQLMKEESLQKEAFSALQCAKDAKHMRLTGQIELIQQELAQLTMLEVEQRELRVETQQDVLETRRHALTGLLSQLLNERSSREQELLHRLAEMEQQRLDHQTDYWLVQYQRLMDMKPQALIDQEKNLEIAVVQIIEDAGVDDYIPTFARHRITIETLQQMSDDDFKQMGIHELGHRKALLRKISEYREQQETEEAKGLKEKKEKPSAPPLAEGAENVSPLPRVATPGSLQRQVTARGLNSECVICMNEVSMVLFLNCGHVCCCTPCSESVDICPMCRADIITKIKLHIAPSTDADATEAV